MSHHRKLFQKIIIFLLFGNSETTRTVRFTFSSRSFFKNVVEKSYFSIIIIISFTIFNVYSNIYIKFTILVVFDVEIRWRPLERHIVVTLNMESKAKNFEAEKIEASFRQTARNH